MVFTRPGALRKSQNSFSFPPFAKFLSGGRLFLIVGFVVAGLLRWAVFPWAYHLPFSFRQDTELTGTVSVFDSIGIDPGDFPLVVHLRVQATGGVGSRVKLATTAKFETVLSEQSPVVKEVMKKFLESATIKQGFWDKLKLTFGDTQVEKEYWVDAGRYTYITPAEAQGQAFIFPVGRVQKKDYTLWDPVTETSFAARYTGSESKSGLGFYTFQGDVGEYDIGTFSVPGLGTRVRVDARGTATFAVERYSGQIADFKLNLGLYAQAGPAEVRVLTLEVVPTTEQGKTWRSSARSTGLLFQFLKTWGPVLSILTGCALYVWWLGRRVKSVKRRTMRQP